MNVSFAKELVIWAKLAVWSLVQLQLLPVAEVIWFFHVPHVKDITIHSLNLNMNRYAHLVILLLYHW